MNSGRTKSRRPRAPLTTSAWASERARRRDQRRGRVVGLHGPRTRVSRSGRDLAAPHSSSSTSSRFRW
eukprot:3266191-Prymnesium_polylepis.1